MPIEITVPEEITFPESTYTLVSDTTTEITEQPAEISAWEKPFETYSVSEFLLLLIAVLLIIQTVLGLFTRKWGFNEW